MSKHTTAIYTDDLSGFTRSLARQLGENSPSHLRLMNMIARALGFQNLQHMRAAQAASRRLERGEIQYQINARMVERAMTQFDTYGRLKQWPSKRHVQTLALWVIWSALPAATDMSEVDINTYLNQQHLFGDPATLRRTMIGCGLLSRETDGSRYKRVEQKPPPEALELFKRLSGRHETRISPATKDQSSIRRAQCGI